MTVTWFERPTTASYANIYHNSISDRNPKKMLTKKMKNYIAGKNRLSNFYIV